jgi:hypothetical protein
VRNIVEVIGAQEGAAGPAYRLRTGGARAHKDCGVARGGARAQVNEHGQASDPRPRGRGEWEGDLCHGHRPLR